MSLKESETSISFQTLQTFTTLLNKNKKKVIRDTSIISALEPLRDVISQIEPDVWETKINKTSTKLSEMSEEDGRVSLMEPKEKKFFWRLKHSIPKINGIITRNM